MADFMFLMHDDAPGAVAAADWGSYIARLRTGGHLEGGSAMAGGVCARTDGQARGLTPHLSGFMLIEADDLTHARVLLAGNPVYEAGGTVEIRELPQTG